MGEDTVGSDLYTGVSFHTPSKFNSTAQGTIVSGMNEMTAGAEGL